MGGKIRTGLSSGIVRALEQLALVTERHAGKSVVIGGIAVIARGVPRLTRDIDIAFSGGDIELPALVHELESVGIAPRIEDAIAFAAENQVLLARHLDSGVDIDISRAWLPFEMEAIAGATRETIAGVTLPMARAEDLVIFKAIAWRPQDRQDIERLIALHRDRMNLPRIRQHVAELGAALEVNRLRELDDLLARL
jgi:predicted nucleotidyltransferase